MSVSSSVDEKMYESVVDGVSGGFGRMLAYQCLLRDNERNVYPSEKESAEDKAKAPRAEELLDIEEFRRLDLRVAHVKSAGMVPGAKKLMKLMVDIGGEERQVVAGIAEHYEPEDLTGKNIIVVTNLKPATIRGVESQGMLLAATDGDKVIVLVPDREASPGARIS